MKFDEKSFVEFVDNHKTLRHVGCWAFGIFDNNNQSTSELSTLFRVATHLTNLDLRGVVYSPSNFDAIVAQFRDAKSKCSSFHICLEQSQQLATKQYIALTEAVQQCSRLQSFNFEACMCILNVSMYSYPFVASLSEIGFSSLFSLIKSMTTLTQLCLGSSDDLLVVVDDAFVGHAITESTTLRSLILNNSN